MRNRLIQYSIISLTLLLAMFMSCTALADEIFFTIFHTNDEHSSLIPKGATADYHPYLPDITRGGMARVAYKIEEIRGQKEAAGEETLLLSGGDFIGGAAFAWLNLFGHSPELSIMQAMGYDAIVIGNHEFDYGPEKLALFLKNAGYPQAHERTAILGSNIVPPAHHPLIEVEIKDTHLITLDNGLQIGMFGLLGKGALDYVTARGDVRFTEQHETARKAVEELQAQGAHIIIALTHSGMGEDRDLARDVDGIDIIVGGHSHTALYEPELEGDTIIIQAGSHLDYLGVLELAYQPDSGFLRLRNEETGQPYLIPIDDTIPKDEDIEEMLVEYIGLLNEFLSDYTQGDFYDVLDTVAYSDHAVQRSSAVQETPMGNFLADAMRLVAEDITGERVDFAFQGNGQIRRNIIPASMDHAQGQISLYDLVEVAGLGMGTDKMPGYSLASIYFTGREVRRVLEISIFLSEFMGNSYFLQSSGLRFQYNQGQSILFTVPVLDIPLATGRAVTRAERFTGEGMQTDDDADFVPLKRGDDELYHVVVDAHILSFLPMVGELLPHLTVVPRDSQGTPLEDLSQAVIVNNGNELKVWEALLYYTASLTENEWGFPEIPEYYSQTRERIVEVWRPPYIAYPAALTAALLAIFLIQ